MNRPKPWREVVCFNKRLVGIQDGQRGLKNHGGSGKWCSILFQLLLVFSNTFQVLCLDLNGCLALQHHITMSNCIYNVSMSTSRNIMRMNILDKVCRAESIQNILLMKEILHQLIWRIPVKPTAAGFYSVR